MIVYTFQTFPYIQELKEQFENVFVFSRLKDDMVAFKKLLEAEPNQVLGVALSKRTSREEPIAVNKFNQGTILHHGAEQLNLTLTNKFPSASKPTHTFCNWTMYHIQNFINESSLSTAFIFIHLNKTDIDRLKLFSDNKQNGN